MAKLVDIIGEDLYKQLPVEKQKELKDQDLENISDGAYVPKERFNQVNEQSKEYKKQVSERDTQITNLKTEYKDVDGLKAKVETLEADNKKKDTEYEDKIATITKENAIEKALGSYKCKNDKLVKALLEGDKLTVDGENIIGLKEQMETIQKENEFLFEKDPAPGAPDFIAGGTDPKPGDPKPLELGERLAKEKSDALKSAENINEFFK